MNPAQQRLLALWAALLSGVVCLGSLPVSRPVAVLLMLAVWMSIAVFWSVVSRRAVHDTALCLDNLPLATYRQPVVLVCGDLPQGWPEASPVVTVTQGCWIRVDAHQDVAQVARQVLWQRPDWGRQLSVMVSVCPQKQDDSERLTSHLLALRWQISRLRKETRHSVPLVLCAQAGSAMMSDRLWQAALAGEGVHVWGESRAPLSIAAWVTAGGAMAMQQQVLLNSLMTWFQRHVGAVFMDENPDIPAIVPTAVLWGMGPSLEGSLPVSVWTDWLSRHTALQQVTGWHPRSAQTAAMSPLPDFVLPLLPEGQGLTPRQRSWRCGLMIFTLAAVAALLGSGWHNRQLLHRLSFDIQHYSRIAMDDYGPKADALQVLRQDAAQLDDWARNGVPLRMGLGLYQGATVRMPVLDAIRAYVAPPPPPVIEKIVQGPKTLRLDSLSLFDSGQAALKDGSTRVLVNALVDIRVKPGWLIVVAGHTDNTGNSARNQTLSRQRAEAVRDWMRDTGDVPESCFAVQGYGASRPMATNDTPEGRALNRRVDISLVPQVDACRIPGNTLTSLQDDDATEN
jgi:outer membrane protein OmpA-like peptidoglycan-associated protein